MPEEHLPHSLSLQEREKLTITGVAEVVRFDEESVVLSTGLGSLIVQGRDLKLRNLSPQGGQVALEGTVTALVYEEPRKTWGGFRGLFR